MKKIVSSIKVFNSSTEIPSPPLALFILTPPEAHLTLHSRMSGSGWVITLSWLSWSLKSILHSSSVHSCHLFLISSSMAVLFLAFIVLILACNVLLLSPISWRHIYSFPLYCFPIFLCVGNLRRPYSLSSLFSGTLHSVGCIFPFLPSLSLFFYPQPPQTTILLSRISYSLGWFW